MRFLFSIFIFISFHSFAQTFSLNKVVPAFSHDIVLAKHSFYEVGYDTKHHLPAWTYYSLTREHLKLANLERKGAFKKDPLLNFTQAGDKDYSSTGLDKGHLVPCEDMSFSEAAMSETFYYSNCIPQTTELNRGEWRSLEELCRNWATEYGEVIVVSGPVFENNSVSIGENKIPVPKTCYKIILRHQEQTYRSIAFLLPNNAVPMNPLPDYICSIDSVEKLTGLDFFADLPDNLETQFESASNKNNWNFEYHHSHPKNNNDTLPTDAVQCKALTKKGVRCKKTTNTSDGYCNLHHK
jgi:endonuclease G, mitochondrial